MKKNIFDKFMKELKDESLTVKRKEQILDIIEREVDSIWRCEIIPSFDAKLDWWSFSNDEKAYNNDGDGSDGGEFDPDEYKDWISIIGEWTGDLGPFESGFPTEFLYSMDRYDKIIDEYEKDKVSKLEIAKKYRQKHSTKKKVLEELAKLPLETLEKILATQKG
jgi:hypothetical protein